MQQVNPVDTSATNAPEVTDSTIGVADEMDPATGIDIMYTRNPALRASKRARA